MSDDKLSGGEVLALCVLGLFICAAITNAALEGDQENTPPPPTPPAQPQESTSSNSRRKNHGSDCPCDDCYQIYQ